MALKLIDVEQWCPVLGLPKYDVSSLGRVRSNTNWSKGHLLKLALCGKGPAKYWYVGLCRNGRRHTRVLHQLVLEAFVGPRPKGMVSRHLDGNRLNCRLSNLAWGTGKENMADRRKHGRGANGERNPGAKLTLAQVLAIRSQALTKGDMKHLANAFDVRVTTIQNIFSGKSWR